MTEHDALHQAFVRGDVGELCRLLGDPPGFPNCQASILGAGWVLEYAIYHAPLTAVRMLLELGADANYSDEAGFPSLIAALSTDRADKRELIALLLDHGADIQQRGHNDYTPLHYAANLEDIAAMELLLARGADPSARTRIDDCATPLEETVALGRTRAAAFLRKRQSEAQ